PMKTAAEVIGVSRSILRTVYRYGARSGSVGPRYRTTNWCPRSRRSSPSYRPTAIGGSTPFSSGSRWPAGLKPLNHKRVYRVMKVHGLPLDRHVGGDERRHDGRIGVGATNRRWCSDGFEIGCDNGERVRVAFALDCCDREAMSFLATTGGIAGEDVRDLMVAAVEYRFGQVNRLPVTIEWLSDNGSCYVAGD